jgi:hypothetical protein
VSPILSHMPGMSGLHFGEPMTVPRDYFVTVICKRRRRPPNWQWEIQRRSKPLDIKFYKDGFKTESAAKLAGEKALRAFLQEIASGK